MQASHDAHGTVLDSLEDVLTSHEIKSASSLVSNYHHVKAFIQHLVPLANCVKPLALCNSGDVNSVTGYVLCHHASSYELMIQL